MDERGVSDAEAMDAVIYGQKRERQSKPGINGGTVWKHTKAYLEYTGSVVFEAKGNERWNWEGARIIQVPL